MQFHRRDWTPGAAQRNHQTVFSVGPVPLPHCPGLVTQAVGLEWVEVAIEVRLRLSVLGDGLLDPLNPFIIVNSAAPGVVP